MKKNLILAMMIMMVSCSSSSKKIDSTSVNFVSGEVAMYVQVADQPAEVSFSRSEDDASVGYIRLKTILKMNTEGLKNMQASNVRFQTLPIASVDLEDDEGNKVLKLQLSKASLPALKTLLTGAAGDTAEVVFETVCNDIKEAKKQFRAATKFAPSQTADIVIGFHIMTDYSKTVYGSKDKCEIVLMLDGTVKTKFHTHNTSYYTREVSTESSPWRKGTWTIKTFERGNGIIEYYDMIMTGWGNSTIRFGMSKNMDYVYRLTWGVSDMVKNNTSEGYKIIKVENITTKKK